MTNASFLFIYLYFSNFFFSQTLFHHCDSLMFYLSLMPGPQSPAPTSSISSLQSSFFSISRPLTDQHEKHQRVYFHNIPFRISPEKMCQWSLRQTPQNTSTVTISNCQTLQYVNRGLSVIKRGQEKHHPALWVLLIVGGTRKLNRHLI